MSSIEQIEERRERLEKSQPSKKEQIQRLEEQIKEFEKSVCELEQRKRENSGNTGLLKEIDRELGNIQETCDGIEEEIWHLKNPPKDIHDVIRLTYEVIDKILPILLRIFDSIRRRQSDVSVPSDLEIYISEFRQFGNHPAEWSKLMAMLQLPKKETDSDSDEEEVPDSDSDKVLEVWKYKLSWLHVIFFQDKIHSDYLSDFGLLMTIALTNCDEYKSILNTEKDDDEMIREFFSDCRYLDMKKYPIIFFKVLDHPTIRSHFLENLKLECLETLHDHLSKICSFFEHHHYARNFTEDELNQMISDLHEVYDMFDVDVDV
jgi:hypothetical protein